MNTEYFNKVLKHPLDKGQAEACFRLENCVVAAGAGSGKTQVLASRFAFLIMECDVKVDQILALTFTKKAANEIYQRVYKILSQFAFHEATPDYAKKRAQQALHNFDKARISTLDSYSGSIVRKGAVLYGIKPDFSSDGNTSFIDTDAIRFVLNHRHCKCINYFSDPADIQNFAVKVFAFSVKEYSSVCSDKDFFSSYLPAQKGEIIKKWPELVENCLDFSSLKDYFQNYQPAKKNEIKRKQEILSVLEKHSSISKKDALQFSNDFESFTDEETVLAKEIILYVKDLLKINTTSLDDTAKKYFTALQKDCSLLSQIINYYFDYPYLVELFALLDEFTAEVNEKKKTSGSLTFSDITELSFKILCEQENIRNDEKKSVKKIMIDEFQDNNGKNRDLLYLISEKDDVCAHVSYKNPDLEKVIQNLAPDKLFFVGDEKQSIYKFRGADVSVFNCLESDLTRITKNKVRLSMTNNYRSTPILLSAFNKLFGDKGQETEDDLKVFKKTSDMIGEDFHAFYENPATYHDTELNSLENKDFQLNENNVPIHTMIYLSKKGENLASSFGYSKDDIFDENNCFCASLVKKITELHEKGISYSQIAVLDKSRTHRKELCRWLNHYHIPYQTDAESSVFSDSLINDIYYYLRYYVYPQDAQAFASLLCSPLAGLTLTSTEMLLEDLFTDDIDLNPFGEEGLSKAKEILSESEYQKYEKCAGLYKPEILTKNGLTALISYLWNETGYRYESLLDTTVNQSARQFDLLFELARTCESEGRTLTWFVDELNAARAKEQSIYSNNESEIDIKEVNYPLEVSDCVNILTIHKSKGLEYDYVFVNGMFSPPKNDSEPLVFWSDKTGLSINHDKSCNYFFQKDKEVFNRMNEAEFRRLVYVAITRAAKEVWLYGSTYSKGPLYTQIVSYKSSKGEEFIGYYDEPSYQTENISSLEEVPEVKLYKGNGCPTDLTLIKPLLKSFTLQFQQKSQNQERKEAKEKLISLLSGNVTVIETEKVEQKRITPSSLEAIHEGENLEELEGTQLDNFANLPKILATYGHDRFGTLVHRYMELAVIAKNQSFELPYELQLNLNNENFKELLNICEIMKKSFFESDTGKAVLESDFVRTEYSFKMLYEKEGQEDKICTGTIDLFFKDKDGGFTIVDYKSDQTICPDKYREQQETYKKAVSEMFDIPETAIKLKLFFLRFGKEISL